MHIIIVDAHDDYLQVVRDYFADQLPGATLTLVHSADAALAAYALHAADVVITAHQIPRCSGVELIRELRSRAPLLPIIMYTSVPDIEKEAYAAGAHRFVLKGTLLRNLVDAVEELLPDTAFG